MSNPVKFAKDTSTRFHPELDLARLRAFHESLSDSPASLLAEQPEDFRKETNDLFRENVVAIDHVIAMGDTAPSSSVPCDVLIFAPGETTDRSMSKLGGLPYWPASRSWPKNWRGKPLSFLGQINFRDSRDVVGDLPGGILVMFVNAHDRVSSFWFDTHDEPLIAEPDLPPGQRKFDPSYGVIHHTYDVPEGGIAESLGTREGVESSIFDLKIGGIPWGYKAAASEKEAFLFQMTSPHEAFEDGRFGWTGVAYTDWRWPFTKGEESPKIELEWWAAYVKQNGKLRWEWV